MPKFYSQLYGLTSLISFPSNTCPTLPSSRLPFLVWPEVQAMCPSSAIHLPWLHLHLGPGARRTDEEQSSGDSSSAYSGQREGLPSLSVSGAQLAALLSLCCHDHFCCVASGWEVRAGNTLKIGLFPLTLSAPYKSPPHSSQQLLLGSFSLYWARISRFCTFCIQARWRWREIMVNLQVW